MKPLPMIRLNEDLLREKEAKVCSHGDTVHYSPVPKFFQGCEGSFLYDREDKPYLDLQMWYSAVNFGYRNKPITDAVKAQLDRLPQLACQYLHEEKVLVAEKLASECLRAFGLEGRVQFNVGGAQAIEDSMKLVRNHTGKSLFMAFMGGYHGRTLGASEITSSYRYRRRLGPFSNRAHFVPFPYCYRCPYDKKVDTCEYYCVNQVERLFETEYNSFWDSRANEPEFVAFYVEPVQATGGYIIPPPEYFSRLKKILDERKILLVDDEIQMGFFRTGKFWAIEHFGVKPNIVVLGLALRIEVTKPDRFTPDKALTDRIFEAGLAGDIPTARGPMGLVLDIGGHYKNVFTLAPSLDITREEIDLGIELLDYLFAQCTKHQT